MISFPWFLSLTALALLGVIGWWRYFVTHERAAELEARLQDLDPVAEIRRDVGELNNKVTALIRRADEQLSEARLALDRIDERELARAQTELSD